MSVITVVKTVKPTPVYNSYWTMSLKSGGGGGVWPTGFLGPFVTGKDTTREGAPASSVGMGYVIGKENYANPDSDPLHPTHYELNSRASTNAYYNTAGIIEELIAAYDPSIYMIAGVETNFAAFDDYKISENAPFGGIGDEYPQVQSIAIQGNITLQNSYVSVTASEYLRVISQKMFKVGDNTNHGFHVYDTSEDKWGAKLSGAYCPFAPGVTNVGSNVECRWGPTLPTLTLTFYIIPITETGDWVGGSTTPAEIDETPIVPEEIDQFDSTMPGVNFLQGAKGSSAGTDLPQWGFEALQEFDYIYIPNTINVSAVNGVVIGVGIVGGSETGYGLTHTTLSIEQIKVSLTEADYMNFKEYAKYDAVGLFDVGDRVFGMIKGTVVFSGYVRNKTRVINDSEQYIQYEASGIREWLYDLPFASTYKATEETIPNIFNTIAGAIPPVLVNSYVSTALPTDTIPEFLVESCTLGSALDTLFDQAGTCAWYIGTDKIMRVYDLTNLTAVNLAMPAEGTALSSSYKILAKDITVDTTNCKTRCILEGDYPYTEKTLSVPCSWKTETIGENTGMVATLNLNREILANLLSDTGSRPKVTVQTNVKLEEFEVIYVNCLTGQIKFVKTDSKQGMYSQVSVQFVEKGAIPIRYDTGWVGTAYTAKGVQRVLLRKDTRFQKIEGAGANSKDTTNLMASYAAKLLAPHKDWKVSGTVVLNDLDLTVAIGKCINFTGTTEDWTAIKAAIIAITWDVAGLRTTIEITNNCYLGTSIPDPIFETNKVEREKYSKIVQLSEAERNNLTNI